MIGVDTNILVYAHRRDSAWHGPARARMSEIAESGAPWAIPMPCIHEFFAICTHPKLYSPPTPFEVALEQIDLWLASPSLVVLSESDRHWSTLRTLVAVAKVIGPAVHDARIAAICIDHGIREFWSADRDFAKFKGLRVVNPLIEDEPKRGGASS